MRRFAIVLVVCVALLAACGSDDDETIRVFAAASLSDAFNELGAEYERANPNITVEFNFAASSALAVQINEGAPADVFASADTLQMAAVAREGVSVSPVLFAKNALVVVVPADSELEQFEGLANDGLRLALAGPDVPVGRYARQVLANASGPDGIRPDFESQVMANLRSEETNVRAVLTKVQLGEADAGIVYRTDAVAAGSNVKVIAIPEPFNVVAEYPIAVVGDGGNAALGFVAFVTSSEGQAIMVKHGFSPP